MKFKFYFALCLLPAFVFANSELFETIEKAGIGTQGYILGSVLSDEQKKTADKNPEEANVAGTYKFKDDRLSIVADKKSDRIVLVYQAYDRVDRAMMKSLVGRYIGEFEAPTTISHNNIIYWFYRANGQKITEDEFEVWRTKMNKIHGSTSSKVSLAEVLKSNVSGGSDQAKLDQLVTIKLQSSKPISGKEEYPDASVYLMISSEKLIREYYGIGN